MLPPPQEVTFQTLDGHTEPAVEDLMLLYGDELWDM